MRKLASIVAAASLLAGCGFTSRDGELIGQAKKVTNVTPLICPDYVAFDISLGVMRGGTGSMSTGDVWLTVAAGVNVAVLKKAVEDGAIVRIRYDRRRFAICTEDLILNAVEITP